MSGDFGEVTANAAVNATALRVAQIPSRIRMSAAVPALSQGCCRRSRGGCGRGRWTRSGLQGEPPCAAASPLSPEPEPGGGARQHGGIGRLGGERGAGGCRRHKARALLALMLRRRGSRGLHWPRKPFPPHRWPAGRAQLASPAPPAAPPRAALQGI